MPHSSDALAKRIANGLGRLSLAVKAKAWKGAGDEGITPTQGEVLAQLADAPTGTRLSNLAHQLGVSAPTASDAVSTLVSKALVEKRAGEDKRAITLTLTKEGKRVAARASDWTGFLASAVQALDHNEREQFLDSLIKIIRALQQSGDISPQRMCVTCEHFRPNSNKDAANPHHCAFINAPFGAAELKMNCADHTAARDDQLEALWQKFIAV